MAVLANRARMVAQSAGTGSFVSQSAVHGYQTLIAGGIATGDVWLGFLLTATRQWCFGIDNSDSDKLKWSPVQDSFASSVMELTVAGALDVDASYSVAGTKVVGARDTGWAAMTGTPDEGTIYDTATITLPQLAGRVMAIQAALTTHGLIGA